MPAQFNLVETRTEKAVNLCYVRAQLICKGALFAQTDVSYGLPDVHSSSLLFETLA